MWDLHSSSGIEITVGGAATGVLGRHSYDSCAALMERGGGAGSGDCIYTGAEGHRAAALRGREREGGVDSFVRDDV